MCVWLWVCCCRTVPLLQVRQQTAQLGDTELQLQRTMEALALSEQQLHETTLAYEALATKRAALSEQVKALQQESEEVISRDQALYQRIEAEAAERASALQAEQQRLAEEVLTWQHRFAAEEEQLQRERHAKVSIPPCLPLYCVRLWCWQTFLQP